MRKVRCVSFSGLMFFQPRGGLLALLSRCAGQISAVIVFAAKRTDSVRHLSPGTLHICRDPVPDLRIANALCATAIGTHMDQTQLAAINGIIRLADRSRVRMHNPQRIVHHKAGTRLKRIYLHPVNAKDLRGGALVIL